MKRAWLLVVALLALPGAGRAHGLHSAQSPAIIDPLLTHHAALEDELKLNFFGARLEAERLTAATAFLELAWAFSDLVGVELFLPFGVTAQDGLVEGGLGDVELQVPKVSFVRRFGWVMTTYAAVTLPTGRRAAGLGGEAWSVAPHLLTDLALGPFGLQLNGAVELTSLGDVSVELRGSLAYTVELSRDRELLLSPLVEVTSELGVRGEPAPEVAALVGAKVAVRGWHVGLGGQLPVAGRRDYDFRVLVQAGYHVSWARLFGRVDQDDPPR